MTHLAHVYLRTGKELRGKKVVQETLTLKEGPGKKKYPKNSKSVSRNSNVAQGGPEGPDVPRGGGSPNFGGW